MQVAVCVFQPRGRALAELVEAFRRAVPDDWALHSISSRRQLESLLADRERLPLVVLPEESLSARASQESLLVRLRKLAADVPIVITAAQGNVATAARAIAAGATDFLVRGEDLPERIRTLVGKLRGLLEAIERTRRLDQQNAQLRDLLQERLAIVGRSPQIRRLLDEVRQVARVPRPMLIVGERGVGKELVARAIHLAAGPAERPLVTLNCAAFSDALLESELFGHERGAFTGAESLRRGKFELADGGTLFLDEIGHMSLAFQEKILRVVEYGTFTRVGGMNDLRTSTRIIAATNRNLQEQIAAGEFLADLYDRLSFHTICVPPLRQRDGDIPVLAEWFLERFSQETPSVAGRRLSHAALAALERYPFPGNVRELKNIIERAACRETGPQIEPADLGLAAAVPPPATGDFHCQLDRFAERLLADALAEAGGNQAQAARRLGLPYHQFRYYLKKHADASAPARSKPSAIARRGGRGYHKP